MGPEDTQYQSNADLYPQDQTEDVEVQNDGLVTPKMADANTAAANSPEDGANWGDAAASAWTEADEAMIPPTTQEPTAEAPVWAQPQDKMVEGDPNASVADDSLVGIGKIASGDLIGNAQTPEDTLKTTEEPETAVPYHSMDPAMDAGTNFVTEVPPVVPENNASEELDNAA